MKDYGLNEHEVKVYHDLLVSLGLEKEKDMAKDDLGVNGKYIIINKAVSYTHLILCVHIYALGLSDMQSGLMVQGNNWGECLGCMIGILLMNGILTTALTTSSQLAEKWSCLLYTSRCV